MELIPLFTKELEQETQTTRKFLELVPEDKFDWKPHDKSMSLKELSVHIAEIPGWIENILQTSGIDFSGGYEPTPVCTTDELKSLLKESVQKSKAALDKADEDDLLPDWTMRDGDQVLMTGPKHGVILHSPKQLTHPRTQLGV